jgi:hypothetical protein
MKGVRKRPLRDAIIVANRPAKNLRKKGHRQRTHFPALSTPEEMARQSFVAIDSLALPR